MSIIQTPGEILDLFDTDKSHVDVDDEITLFLEKHNKDKCLIFFYTGHADFSREQKLMLMLKSTNLNKLDYTGYSVEQLARNVNSLSSKNIIILDCCFAGSAFSCFQMQSNGDLADIYRAKITNHFTESDGTLLFAACTEDNYAKLEKHSTAFSYGLTTTLLEGSSEHGALLSMEDIEEITGSIISKKFKNAPKPQLYSPKRINGDLRKSKFIPNLHYIKQYEKLNKSELIEKLISAESTIESDKLLSVHSSSNDIHSTSLTSCYDDLPALALKNHIGEFPVFKGFFDGGFLLTLVRSSMDKFDLIVGRSRVLSFDVVTELRIACERKVKVRIVTQDDEAHLSILESARKTVNHPPPKSAQSYKDELKTMNDQYTKDFNNWPPEAKKNLKFRLSCDIPRVCIVRSDKHIYYGFVMLCKDDAKDILPDRPFIVIPTDSPSGKLILNHIDKVLADSNGRWICNLGQSDFPHW